MSSLTGARDLLHAVRGKTSEARSAVSVQAQQISLNYHCKCEQFVHFASGGFFNFNGTAGEQWLPLTARLFWHVWRSCKVPVCTGSVCAPGSFACMPLGKLPFCLRPMALCSPAASKHNDGTLRCGLGGHGRRLEAAGDRERRRLEQPDDSGGHGPVSEGVPGRLEGHLPARHRRPQRGTLAALADSKMFYHPKSPCNPIPNFQQHAFLHLH